MTVDGSGRGAAAAGAGADVLVAQGSEAGGHRGSFTDDPADDSAGGFGLLALLQLIRSQLTLPLVAAGGIGTGAGIAAVLAAGAAAAQLGTAFLRCPEAGTSQVQRDAVATATGTSMTRAFTGRLARGIRNGSWTAHSADAPAAYPEVHYLTAPLRAAGRAGRERRPGQPVGRAGTPAEPGTARRRTGHRPMTDARAALRAAAGRYGQALTARDGRPGPGLECRAAWHEPCTATL